jgi:ABC-type sugar transport system ATPase subunit
VRRLADRGLAVLLVSHNLRDVFEVANRIAVLRLGRMVASGPLSDFDAQSVVQYMTFGRAEPTPDAQAHSAQQGS